MLSQFFNTRLFHLVKTSITACTLLITSALLAGIAAAEILGPPPYEVKDRHGVNMQSGQVSPSQTDISIGGSLGLSHTLTTYTSNFVNWDDDPRRGTIYNGGFFEPYSVSVGETFWNATMYPEQRVIRVMADNSTVEFYFNADRTVFSPKSDTRYTLQKVTNPTDPSKYHQSIIAMNTFLGGFSGYIMSKPDGTLVYLPSDAPIVGYSSPTAGTNPTTWTGTQVTVTMPPSPNTSGTYTITWTGTGHHSWLTRDGVGVGPSGMGGGSVTETSMNPGTYTYVVNTCPRPDVNDCTQSAPLSMVVDRPVPVYGKYLAYTQRPNGLVITSKFPYRFSDNSLSSVTTNTGFQLKYVYQYNSVEIPSPADRLPASNSSGWSYANPKLILGINNAVDGCTTEPSAITGSEGKSPEQLVQSACPGLTNTWPKAVYTWPNGMPRALFASTDAFKVTDADGITTEYWHTPVDTKNYPDPYYRNAARLSSIKRGGKVLMNYQFETRGVYDGTNYVCPTDYNGNSTCTGIAPNPGEAAVLIKSWIGADLIEYSTGGRGNRQQATFGNGAYGTKIVSDVVSTRNGMITANSWDKSVSLEGSPSNRTQWVDNKLGKRTDIAYDESLPIDAPANPDVATNLGPKSHNVYTLTESGGVVTKAEGYLKCTLLNYKVCNQPTKITDPKNNITYYEYDPVTGQVAKTSSPTDKAGVRAQARYQYTALYAYYKKDGAATVTKAGTPLYLLTRESKCQNTAATSSGGCLGGTLDEVVTTYDYGPQNGTANNLLLRGVTVAAQGVTQRTCYQYDIYGNRIGETKPNAQLASCY